VKDHLPIDDPQQEDKAQRIPNLLRADTASNRKSKQVYRFNTSDLEIAWYDRNGESFPTMGGHAARKTVSKDPTCDHGCGSSRRQRNDSRKASHPESQGGK
jgi:hypothetical protein